MKLFFIFLFISNTFLSLANNSHPFDELLISGDKGNGGDVLKCTINGKEVYKTLDSAIMEDSGMFERSHYKNSTDALSSIILKLSKTLPQMAQQLQEFVSIYHIKRNDKRTVFWINSDIIDIYDENLSVHIPEYCDSKILQAVILVKSELINGTGDLKKFYYNRQLFEKLTDYKDELSWIIIHEFLRSYVIDSELIRGLNLYFHSNEFLIDNEYTVKSQLNILGISDVRSLLYSELVTIEKKINIILKKFEKNKEQFSNLKLLDIDSLSKNKKRDLNLKLRALRFLQDDTLSVYSYYRIVQINQDAFISEVQKYNSEVLGLISKLNN